MLRAIFRTGEFNDQCADACADDERLDVIPQEYLYRVAYDARNWQQGVKSLLTVEEMVAAWKRLQMNKQEELF